MKILVITNHSYMLWRFRKELLQELQKENEVAICTPFVGHEEKFAALGFSLYETKVERRGMNPIKDAKLFVEYDRIIRKEKPDLVITYSIKPNIYGGIVCRIKKIPYCTNVQGLGTAFQRKGIAMIATTLYKTALKKANVVFFENEENARVFRVEKITSSEQQVVLNGAGINLQEYPMQPYEDHDKVHFLYLGRIMREKGVGELFQAVRKLWETYPEKFVLELVGFFEDEYKEEVDQLVKDGIAAFHGFQENPRPYYGMADCVVLPSYHEGLSNVLLEAAATGRGIITTNIPGCREVVGEEGNGLLCEVKNAESLYKKMEQYLNMSAEAQKTMGVRGRQLVEEIFDKKLIVEKTVTEIKKHMDV